MTDSKFRNRAHFPGSQDNYFGKIVNALDRIDDVPSIVFAVVLFLIAFIASGFSLEMTFVLWMFYLGDWLLLALLPKARISFGHAKPQVFVLSLFRSLGILIPLPWFIVLQLIGTVLVIYGFWIEPRRVVLHREYFQTSKLQPGSSVRILHIGDLHIDRISIREEKVTTLIHELEPDVILFSGDILSYSSVDDPAAWVDARKVLGEFSAPRGAYMVSGSPPIDREDILPHLLDGLSLELLQNKRVSLGDGGYQIDIIGIACTHKPFIDGPMLREINMGSNNRFTILLYHSPDLAPVAAEEGIDIQLSGHTHGGQVRLPWYGALYTSSLYGKRFEAGRKKLNGLTLYVTRGLGFEGKGAPRVRFLCPPEIVLWELSSDR